jgi:hypothetical protein
MSSVEKFPTKRPHIMTTVMVGLAGFEPPAIR